MRQIAQGLGLVLTLVVGVLAAVPSGAERQVEPTVPMQRAMSTEQSGQMKFLMTFTGRGGKENRTEAIARFRKTRGEPPRSVKLLSRWTRADFSKVYVLVETQDLQALAQYALDWDDLMEVHTVPVLDDTQLLKVLDQGQ